MVMDRYADTIFILYLIGFTQYVGFSYKSFIFTCICIKLVMENDNVMLRAIFQKMYLITTCGGKYGAFYLHPYTVLQQ